MITTSPNSDIFMNLTLDSCFMRYDEFNYKNSVRYCNWTFDTILCWPPTPAGTIAKLPCPPGHGIDRTKFAERKCSLEGQWEGKPNDYQSQNTMGWTNYTPCYTPEMLMLMKKLGSGDMAKIKMDIAEKTRLLEFVGFTLSLISLLVSLLIFCYFRTLRNNRTRIHKNLFIAMVIQVVIRLIVYADQAVTRNGSDGSSEPLKKGINNTPLLCEASFILLENARTAMFMWMFIEGLYLHNVVTVTVFQGKFPHRIYAVIGWGGPILMTVIWASVTAIYVGPRQSCWWGYNLTPYYWILEGPRLAVILLNFIFLLNIIRVLIVKLRQSHTSDVEQVRKAVRAAILLLPLLGITNILHMVDAPLDKSAWEFALWSYITHFLTSFQGFFIAMLYCFLNGEVRAALVKGLSVYMSLRGYPDWISRRQSMFSAAYATAPATDGPCNDDKNRNGRNGSENRNWLNMCFRQEKLFTGRKNDIAPPKLVEYDIFENN